jgi:hypothetical protein
MKKYQPASDAASKTLIGKTLSDCPHPYECARRLWSQKSAVGTLLNSRPIAQPVSNSITVTVLK